MESSTEQSDRKRIRWRAGATVAIHGLIPLAWIIGAAVVIPRFRTMFGEMGSELPAMTACLLKVSSIASNNWPLYIFIMAAVLVGDAAICTLILSRSSRTVLRMWSASILLIQGALSAIALVALYKPLIDTITAME